MMLLSLLAAFAAEPPTTESEVDALLHQLIDPSPEARIQAANALAKTPPALVGRLEFERISVCHERIAKRDLDLAPDECLRWNHAMYHYIRVVGALARQSVDPSTPVGAYCRPRTQPHPGDLVQKPACPLGSTLRWMVRDAFDVPDLIEADATQGGKPVVLPEAVRAEPLTASARAAWEQMLRLEIADAAALARYQPFEARAAGTRFAVVPTCGGMPGFRELCSFVVIVEADGGRRFQSTLYLPPLGLTDADTPGSPGSDLRMAQRVHVRVSEDGRYGLFGVDLGEGDEAVRRLDLYDLSGAPVHHCRLQMPLSDAPEPLEFPRLEPPGCLR